MKIVVLAGGLSPEREVSLSSGSLIANALMEKGHRVLLLDVYRGMRELPADPDSLFRTGERYTHTVTERVPDLDRLRREVGIGDALVGPNVAAYFLRFTARWGRTGSCRRIWTVRGFATPGRVMPAVCLQWTKS